MDLKMTRVEGDPRAQRKFECCRREENMKMQDPDIMRPDLKLEICAVCGRRHFELSVDPGVIGVKTT